MIIGILAAVVLSIGALLLVLVTRRQRPGEDYYPETDVEEAVANQEAQMQDWPRPVPGVLNVVRTDTVMMHAIPADQHPW